MRHNEQNSILCPQMPTIEEEIIQAYHQRQATQPKTLKAKFLRLPFGIMAEYKAVCRWLWAKKVTFDCLIGLPVYDTQWEPAVLYVTCGLVFWLVLWGAVIQLRNCVYLWGTLLNWIGVVREWIG